MSIFGSKDCPDYEQPAPPKFPRFCSRCGSALVPEISRLGYNEKTGQPKYDRWLRCPNWDGGQAKFVAPTMTFNAAFLNPTYDARLYPLGGMFDCDYMDCSPAYVAPAVPARKARA